MQKKGDKFKFICQYIIEATPDFTYYYVKEDNGDSYDCRKYLEKHINPYLTKNAEYEATVMERTLFEEGKNVRVVTVLKVNSIADDSVKSRVMYRAENVGVLEPLFIRITNFFKKTKRKMVH